MLSSAKHQEAPVIGGSSLHVESFSSIMTFESHLSVNALHHAIDAYLSPEQAIAASFMPMHASVNCYLTLFVKSSRVAQ